MYHDFSYPAVITAAGQRAAWRIEDVLPEGAQLDFSRPFMPEALAQVQPRMDMPTPRVALGLALRGVARAALDISDGLLGDLGHILTQSRVGATITVDNVPRSATLAAQPLALQLQCTLAGGDDYELCFTAPADARDAVVAAGQRAGVAVTRIGRIDAEAGLRLVDAHGAPVLFTHSSFDYFSSAS